MIFEDWRVGEGLRESQTHEELEAQLCDFMEERWAEGDTKSSVSTLLAAVQHFGKCRGKIPEAWKLLSAWSKMEVPNRAPPMTSFMVTSMVGRAIMQGKVRLAAGLWLAFAGCLRTGELIKLKCADIEITSGGTMTVALTDTKTSQRLGADRCVVVDDPHVIALCQIALKGRSKDATLMGLSSYEFRKEFDALLRKTNLEKFDLHPYSLRRGGATHLFQLKESMERILLIGRWKSLATAKIYLQDGAARIAQQRISVSTRKLGDLAIAEVFKFLKL